jgi:hypothetical protein
VPISPIYGFNKPGQPVVLYLGPVGGLTNGNVAGTVELACAPRPSLEWRTGFESPGQLESGSAVTLLLRRPDGDVPLPAYVRGPGDGWANGVIIGRDDAPLARVVAHWFNLPNWHGPKPLAADGEDGFRHVWAGRWVTETAGWRITIDARPDHYEIWPDLDKADVYVMTHVMELCRADDAAFTAEQARPVLDALHVGVSFALGRWVAPMLPVGLNSSGKAAWEDWRILLCDPPHATAQGWWYQNDHQALGDLLSRVIPIFADAAKLPVLRFQMLSAIAAMGDHGYADQRVMIGAAGLENLTWQTLVINGPLDKHQHNKKSAHELLRTVLVKASIPADIDANLLPVAAKYAADERIRQGHELDAAEVAMQVRNRLVHPNEITQHIYAREGLVREAWLLIRHYLVLLILNSLGYQGQYRDLRRISGLASDRTIVPWGVPQPPTSQQ